MLASYATDPGHVTTVELGRVFLREVAVVGRAAGLRPGNLASYVCDALFFQDTPWIGTSLGGIDAGTPIEASMWKKHRDVFRDMLNSFISASR